MTMTATPTIFDSTDPPVAPDLRGLTLQQRFEAFDAANPQVYKRLVAMTAELVSRGRKRVGMGMLFEVLRWEHAMSTEDATSEFKLNNSNRSRYVRKIVADHPEWADIFEQRELKA